MFHRTLKKGGDHDRASDGRQNLFGTADGIDDCEVCLASYAVGRSLSEYRWEKDLDWGEFDSVQKATIEEEWRAQRQANPIKKVQQVLLGDLSRFGSELHFFRRCSTPYEILGCGIYESPVQIKKRNRLLVQKWHPDRVRGLGATDKEVLHTTEILQIINGAYSILTAAKAA